MLTALDISIIYCRKGEIPNTETSSGKASIILESAHGEGTGERNYKNSTLEFTKGRGRPLELRTLLDFVASTLQIGDRSYSDGCITVCQISPLPFGPEPEKHGPSLATNDNLPPSLF